MMASKQTIVNKMFIWLCMHGQPQYKASMCDPAELRAGNVFLEVLK